MKTACACSLFFRLARRFLCLTLLCLPGLGTHAARQADIIPVITTIQAAINDAQDGDTISIPAGTYTESLTIDKNLILAGQSSSPATIQAVTDQRVITVQPGHNLTIQDLRLTNGSGVNEGGAVRIENGILTINHSSLYNNQADYGGAVFQGGSGQVIVENYSYIYNNHAVIHGGGIYANNNLNINSSWMEGNIADAHGGAATVWAGNLTVVSGAISFNQAGQNGGAFNVANSVHIDQVVFISNVAGENGGALLQWNGNDAYSVVIQNSTFNQNKAGLTGGALSIYQGAATSITQSQFNNNEVDTQSATDPKGGAVYYSDTSWGHTIAISNTTFSSNTLICTTCLWPSGGGLYAVTCSPGVVNLDGLSFINNQGWLGGGVAADRAVIHSTTFQGNSGGSGAGAYLTGTSRITKSAFFQNSVVNTGGGLHVSSNSPSLVMEDTKFIGNSGGYDLGGAMLVDAQAITMKNVAVADTQVVSGGAILFGNPDSTIELYHMTVNDTHLQGGIRTGTSGIHVIGPTIVNIWNSMITNHGTGVEIDAGSACSLDHTLWYGNALNIDGSLYSYADNYPVSSDPAYAVDRHHLTAASGAINNGVDRLVLHDIDGDTRVSLPDIGADEFWTHIYLPQVIHSP